MRFVVDDWGWVLFVFFGVLLFVGSVMFFGVFLVYDFVVDCCVDDVMD